MAEQYEIDQQLDLLEAHRQTLSGYLKQRALLGRAYEPPGVTNGINEARKQIRYSKDVLRKWGVPVDDVLGDESMSPPLLQKLREKALRVFYAEEQTFCQKDWEKAVNLLEEVLEEDPSDKELEIKLDVSKEKLRLCQDYITLREWRDEGRWREVKARLDDVSPEVRNIPEIRELYTWAYELYFRVGDQARANELRDYLEAGRDKIVKEVNKAVEDQDWVEVIQKDDEGKKANPLYLLDSVDIQLARSKIDELSLKLNDSLRLTDALLLEVDSVMPPRFQGFRGDWPLVDVLDAKQLGIDKLNVIRAHIQEVREGLTQKSIPTIGYGEHIRKLADERQQLQITLRLLQSYGHER